MAAPADASNGHVKRRKGAFVTAAWVRGYVDTWIRGYVDREDRETGNGKRGRVGDRRRVVVWFL
jgi:hypothetical protein